MTNSLRSIVVFAGLWLALAGGAFGQSNLPNAGGSQLPTNPGGGGGASSGSAIPGYTNFDSALLPFTSRCIARVRSGKGNCRIATVGDSTTAGQGAGTDGSGVTNAWYLSYPTQLANLISASGIPAHQDSFMGASWGSITDNRATLNTWANIASGAYSTYGGAAWYNNSDTTSFIWAPVNPVDTFVVWFNTQVSGGATVTINIDGGATLATVNTQTGATGCLATTVGGSGASITPGTHQVRIQRNGTGTLAAIMGIEAYNATVPSVSVINAGWVGSRTSFWSDNTEGAGSPLSCISTVAADLMIVNLGINDELNAVPNATSLANMQAVVAAQTQPITTYKATNPGIGGTAINGTIPTTISPGEVVIDITSGVRLGTVTAVHVAGGWVDITPAANWAIDDVIQFQGPGDTIVVVPSPLQLNVASQVIQDAYTNNVMIPLVGSTIPLAILPHFDISWNSMTAMLKQFDSYHPTGLGYGAHANAIAPVILQAGGL